MTKEMFYLNWNCFDLAVGLNPSFKAALNSQNEADRLSQSFY